MSYRNPKIIDDKSGMVLGQAIAAGAQNISKGLIAGQARKEKEEAKAKLEAEKKQAKEDRRVFQTSKAIKDSYADQAAWAKKLDGDLEGLNDFTVGQMSSYMEVAKNLELERINGAYGPDYLKRLEDNQKNIGRINTFTSGIIGARADAGAVIDMTEVQRDRDTAFIPLKGSDGEMDTGQLAEDATYAIGGLKGYDIGFSDKGVKITRPGENNDAFIDIDTWNSVSDNLYYNRKGNTTKDMEGLINKDMYIKDASGKQILNPSLTTTTAIGDAKGESISPIPSGINNDGYYTFRQNFNQDKVDAIRDTVLLSTFDKLESFGPEKYKQKLWMRDLEQGGFKSDEYNKLESKEEKRAYLEKSAEAQFLAIADLKKDGDTYYRTIRGKKASETKASKREITLSKTYNRYATGLSAIEELEGTAEKVQAIIKLASLGEGASIARGSSKEYVGNLNLTDDYVVQFGKETTKGKRPGYNLKTPSGAENFLRNKTGIEDQDQLDKLVAALQAAIAE
jgi:hypothetical protein